MSEPNNGAIADELAVRDVILALSLEGDTGELEAYGALLADDAVLESPGGLSEGRKAILASAAERRSSGTIGPGSGSRHHVVPGRVTVDGNRAVGRSFFSFYVTAEGRPALALIGEYDDEFRRDESAWRLARRHVTFG